MSKSARDIADTAKALHRMAKAVRQSESNWHGITGLDAAWLEQAIEMLADAAELKRDMELGHKRIIGNHW